MIFRPCARTTPSATARKRCRSTLPLERAIKVIRVFDHKRVVVAGDEIDEDLVVLECAPVSGIEHLSAIRLASRHRSTQGFAARLVAGHALAVDGEYTIR
jgi:hypothetical protein